MPDVFRHIHLLNRRLYHVAQLDSFANAKLPYTANKTIFNRLLYAVYRNPDSFAPQNCGIQPINIILLNSLRYIQKPGQFCTAKLRHTTGKYYSFKFFTLYATLRYIQLYIISLLYELNVNIITFFQFQPFETALPGEYAAEIWVFCHMYKARSVPVQRR